MAKETVNVEGVRHFACSICHRPLEGGYDSQDPKTPGNVLCGPHYQEEFAIIYQSELAMGIAHMPDVPDLFLQGVVEEVPADPVPEGTMAGLRRRIFRKASQ